ncbi:hypothetical protein [uncultured Kordia sp.]|uniref:hypothetical protein n=1 Tax=uncultured Kordia sp. TaxID=507699 RepID=UPI00260D1388|nr:hypothetical protein [uncultured Kordia sp.]
MKHLWTYCLIFFICVSCDFFKKPVVTEEELVAQEKESINLNTVDVFPSFSNCDSLEKEQQKTCFFQTLTDQIYEQLAQNNIQVTKTIRDTIQVAIYIDTLGIIKVSDIQKKPYTDKYIPSLDSLIEVSAQNLPKASPAYKRGIPVKTKFLLPIILHVEEPLKEN